jgi:signal transduction histidine kinase
MSRLVHDLLILARADAGHHLDRAPLDLCAVIGEVCRQARGLHPARAFHLQGVDGATVRGNEDALKQLAWILVDNAVKHTRDGGNIWLSLARRRDLVQLHVADDGTGIPEGDLPRVFDRFYQADTARSDGGAGLGLAIARWIVDEHDGRIFARNNNRGGATLTVELPAAPSPSADS